MKDFKRRDDFGDKKRGDFPRRGSSHGSFGRGGRDSARPEMYTTTCAECGNSCEVPFKPSGDRPVYCSNCFKNKREGSTAPRQNNRDNRDFSKPRFESPARSGAPMNNGAPTGEQFIKLNAKLDKILSILESLDVEEEDYEADGEVVELPDLTDDVKKNKGANKTKNSGKAKSAKSIKTPKPSKNKKPAVKKAGKGKKK